MAKKKQGGKTRQQKRTSGKSLGLKVSGGQKVSTGDILIRQRGTKYHAGDNVNVGRDHTLFSLKKGSIKFSKKNNKTVVSVL